MAGQRFYEDAEAEEILRRAAASTMPAGSVSHEGLLSVAAELGISAEAVAEAEAQVREEREDKALRKQFRQHQVGELWSNLGGYVVTNAFLIWVFHFPNWIWWVIGGWGISIAKSVWETFGPESVREIEYRSWREKKTGSRAVAAVSGSADAVLDAYFAEGNTSDDKIAAIKHLRTATGMGLKEAKDATDAYFWNQGWK